MSLPARTTQTLVSGIIEIDTDTWPDITPFIDVANDLVTEVVDKLDPVTGVRYYNDERLEKIERWLAAHFYAVADERTIMERADVVSEQFATKIDLGFDQTKYGQMAMRLDTHGGLATINNVTKKIERPLNAGVSYLGTKPSSPLFGIEAGPET